MRVLVLGADGMLGHQLIQGLRADHEVAGTVRGSAKALGVAATDTSTIYTGVDATDFASIERVLDEFRPSVVINGIGIVKQRAEVSDPIQSIEINALLPHRLAGACVARHMRLVHLSTDCVFSGAVGNYADDACSDASDLYGRTKYLGEVSGPGVITLRTSIIGLELHRRTGLVEWFLAQKNIIHGFELAIYTGFTTLEITNIINIVIARNDASGVYNVSSDGISKYLLLSKLNELLQCGLIIEKDQSFRCDRSLNSRKFRSEFGYDPPTWDEMLAHLAEQITVRMKNA